METINNADDLIVELTLNLLKYRNGIENIINIIHESHINDINDINDDTLEWYTIDEQIDSKLLDKVDKILQKFIDSKFWKKLDLNPKSLKNAGKNLNQSIDAIERMLRFLNNFNEDLLPIFTSAEINDLLYLMKHNKRALTALIQYQKLYDFEYELLMPLLDDINLKERNNQLYKIFELLIEINDKINSRIFPRKHKFYNGVFYIQKHDYKKWENLETSINEMIK